MGKNPNKFLKKKAYNHFSQLSNIFSDNSLVEKFSWSKPNGPKTQNETNNSETVTVPGASGVSMVGTMPAPGPSSTVLTTADSNQPTQAITQQHCSAAVLQHVVGTTLTTLGGCVMVSTLTTVAT